MVLNNWLGFEPMNSPTLNETFKNWKIDNIDEKYESLLKWGIAPDFAEQLAKMFDDIKATADEVIKVKPEIVKAANNIDYKINSQRHTKANLAMLKHSANNSDYNWWVKNAA